MKRLEGWGVLGKRLILPIAVYLLLTGIYFFIVPIFEAPDEWTHTGHVAYIAKGNGLPVMLPGQGIWGGQQPPLYYAIGALLVQPFQTDGVEEYVATKANPHASVGYALDPGNKNIYLHGPEENFPYSGLALTVHVLRLYSMLFGLVTLVFTYLTAFEFFKRVFPLNPSQKRTTSILPPSLSEGKAIPPARGETTPLPVGGAGEGRTLCDTHHFATIVALFVACQPMFGFINASVANETANMAFSAIALWLTQRYVLHGPSPQPWRAIALGGTIGLISLSKMTGLAFVLAALVVFLQTSIATRKNKGAAWLLWRDGVLLGIAFLLVGGWWYWRNYQLYGDFFQQGLYKIYFNQTPQPLSLSKFLFILGNGEVSFWATFGWLNIVAPEWVYSIYRVISRIGLIGVGVALTMTILSSMKSPTIPPEGGVRTKLASSEDNGEAVRQSPPLLIHFVFPVALAFSLTRLVALEGGLQGRQLLPALGSMAIIIIYGWWVITPRFMWRWMSGGLVVGLLALALWLPYSLVIPAYVPTPVLVETDLPSNLERLNLIYADSMKLIGVELEQQQVKPGERVPVTVYWQVIAPMEKNYSVFVHLFGRERESVGQLNTYLGLGLYPTQTLQPGQIIKDTYPVLINGGSQIPALVQVNIGLFDFNEPGRPGIQPTLNGQPAQPTVAQFKLAPAATTPKVDYNPLAEFADQIWLVDYELNGCQTNVSDCELGLTWAAQGQPNIDYTIFIQLWPSVPSENPPFYGFDGPPLNNDYPTSYWDTGEIIIDLHHLDLAEVPAGIYQILIGLYDPTTGGRVPVSQTGERLENDTVELEIVEILGEE